MEKYHGLPSGSRFSTSLSEVAVGELGENLIAVCECGHGHKCRVLSPPVKHFELLGHAGIDAYIQGFYGEAVMDLMAATERAYEYFCQVAHHFHGRPFETFEEAWQKLGKLSERRLGWFSAVWLAETGKPFVLPKKQVEFRNDVIHNGTIPSRLQVEQFGEWVVSVLFDLCDLLKRDYSDSMMQCGFHYGKKRHTEIMKKVNADPHLRDLPDGGGGTSSVFGLNILNYERLSFAELVEKVNKPNLYGPNPTLGVVGGERIQFKRPVHPRSK